jgi:23S rRNA-/tRNA-specific pseudouridylate synthase
VNKFLCQCQVLLEDSTYLAVNKPKSVHSDEVLAQGNNWELVHRLDFETSGVLLFSKPEILDAARKLFSQGTDIKKLYIAGATGEMAEGLANGEPIDGFIASRYRSSKKVRFIDVKSEARGWHSIRPVRHIINRLDPEQAKGCSFSGKLYKVQLVSGARHQIRAFFAAEKIPLVGDVLYGAPKAERLELHSWRLEFKHVVTGAAVEIEAACA